MRETVCVHVGQCGNQIGSVFWDMLLHEHERTPDSDYALSSFFYFAPAQRGGGGGSNSHVMKARALMIDMECGVLQETMRGPLGALFDNHHYIYDVSGAGNNFAQGYYHYGPVYKEKILEGLRKNAEQCESLQTYLVTHSLGGGTGSGVGSFLLGVLDDEYPKVARFTNSVFPSQDNDVITSPYNTILSTKELTLHADCVFPILNQALFNIFQLEQKKSTTDAAQEAQRLPADKKARNRGFDDVNGIAARMLCHLTASSRFHGEMNVDMNEIYTNLVPFPKTHFLLTSMNIRYPKTRAAHGNDVSHSAVQRAFADLIANRGGHLTGISPSSSSSSVTLASAFIARGSIPLSEFIHGVGNVQKSLRFPKWNQDACKVGRLAPNADGAVSPAFVCIENAH